jgi:soluble lytic murein transglycosylase-like protein
MKLPLNLIYAKAVDFDLDAMIVAAIVWAESKGFVYAVRLEPKYRYLYYPEKFAKKNNITVETEINLQKQSYGLCQCMGGTARWLGYTGALPALYKPENNLYWSCKYLAFLKKQYGPGYEPVVSAYNQGNPRVDRDKKYTNQKYVDEVFSAYRELLGVNKCSG